LWNSSDNGQTGETGGDRYPASVGTKICITKDNLIVQVELPEGFAFLTNDEKAMEKTLPVFATYACYCSVVASACTVFYSEGLGFGCLQSSCTGSCTGKFTYKGYSIDRVIDRADKTTFFSAPEIQEQIRQLTKDVSPLEPFGRFSVRGIDFFYVQDEKAFLAQASCDCEGTLACKMKVVTLLGKKIYFCEGACNGCELTVN
jgi:hypothetical protein